jgi:nucleoside-diphosphate-sugar epimerase
MKFLVTGASGFVGRSLCAELFQQGHEVVAAVRSANTQIDDFERVTVGTIDSATDWSAALYNADIVIHLAARVHVMSDVAVNPLDEFRKINVEGTLNLASQAVMASVKRFIFISSVKVNGEHTEVGAKFTEIDKPHPQDAYGISKLEAEQGLLSIAERSGMEVVIVRPPLIYGVGVKANFANMMRAVKRGIPMPFGTIHNKRSFVYVENLISLILLCITHPAAANEVFMVSDGDSLSTTELLRECARALGVKSRLFPVPQKVIEFGANLLGKADVAQRLCGNLQVDISKARTLLGWEPPFSVEEGLRLAADGFRNTHS